MAMEKLFVPYQGECPSAVWINGHKLVIASPDEKAFAVVSRFLAFDRVREIPRDKLALEEEEALQEIATQLDSGIVLAPSGTELDDVIEHLEETLPWLH